MHVSWTRYGMFVGLAASAVLLTGCGGGGGKSNAAPTTAAPTAAASDSAAPSDAPSTQPSGPVAPSSKAPLYTGPTLGPGHKCGTVTIVSGSIQCSHAEKVYLLYTQNKKPDGKAVFAGWTCAKETTGIVCDRSGIKLRKA